MRRAALTWSDRIAPRDLADSLGDGESVAAAPQGSDRCISLPQRIRSEVHAIERDSIELALKQAMGNKAKAARLLGIDYKTYRTKLKKLEKKIEAAADE
jgi:DNA-binding NtrC family response regulator